MYSVILDEYEISYMLLNIMIIKKNIKQNSNSKMFLNYELISDKPTINYIPIIFKYIKDNPTKNQIVIDEIYLFEDAYIENIFMMIMEIIVCILLYKTTDFNIDTKLIYNLNDDYYADKNNIMEPNNIIEQDNLYMEITIENDDVNTNIWCKSNTNSTIKNKSSNITFKLKSENDNSPSLFNTDTSEIEEKEICFSNII
jgi:hypothetical protein